MYLVVCFLISFFIFYFISFVKRMGFHHNQLIKSSSVYSQLVNNKFCAFVNRTIICFPALETKPSFLEKIKGYFFSIEMKSKIGF